MQVPNNILNYIADSMEAGEKCFIHKETLQVVTYPEDDLFDFDLEDDPVTKPWQEDINKVNSEPENYIEIEKMNSSQSYEVMEEFVDTLENNFSKVRLLKAITGRKPFANFKHQIENSGYERELWFAFRRTKNIEWIRDQLKDED